MRVEINGSSIRTPADFHREIAAALGFPSYYGGNLDALWDALSTDVERPVTLVWINSNEMKTHSPDDFNNIVSILLRAENQDNEFGWDERFNFQLL